MEITLNQEQQLFVIQHPTGGWTCRGFDNLVREVATMIERCPSLKDFKDRVAASIRGTIEQYRLWEEMIGVLARSGGHSATWYHRDTPENVKRALERYRKSRKLVRIFLGNPVTGRDSAQEYNMLGSIGRSTGVMKVPLLIAQGEGGGPALSDDSIVRIIDVETRREVYRHPSYHHPVFDIVPEHDCPGYTHSVTHDGALVARFKSYGRAAAYVAYLTGDSMTPTE